MVTEEDKSKRFCIGQSTHCTSFGVSEYLTLSGVKFPTDLRAALNKSLVETPKDSQLYENYLKLINRLPHIKKIKPKYYLILFKILLYLEDYEIQLIVAKHNLKNHRVKCIKNMIEIIVPTLNEDDPFINIGDTIKLSMTNLNSKYYCKIIDVIGNKIYTSIPKQFFEHQEQLFDMEVNIDFLPRNWLIKCSHYVLHIMFKYNLVNLVYPEINRNHYPLPDVDLDWIQTNMVQNIEQKTAVKNILNKSAYPAPYILFGPPGTGKTTTLVEAICQIRKQYRSKNILVCTSSNAAANEIAKRLLFLLPRKDVFQMYASSYCCSKIDKEINPSSNLIDDMVIYLPKEIFILKKIVITTLATCIRLVNLKLRNDHFSYIFIDEASQSIELESLIPLTVMNLTNKTKEVIHAQIIIAGDPYQLGPIIRCKKIEHLLGKSLLERLMECEPYKKVNNKYNSRYITKLVHNYRNKEAILHTSNELFYDNALLCYKKENMHNITSSWAILSKKIFPILFLIVKGKEIRTFNMSIYNEIEVTVVTKCITKLMSDKLNNREIKEIDIGIITPFKQQKLMIKKSLIAHKLNNISVGTIETYQGQEKEIILLSTVRSQSFKHNNKEHIGFLSNPKRFNVALTRAKNLLIIIGNPSILCKDQNWNILWQYCKKNNAYIAINKNLI